MTSKTETTKAKKTTTEKLKSFYFPTVLNGLTIKAASREEANKKAAEIAAQNAPSVDEDSK